MEYAKDLIDKHNAILQEAYDVLKSEDTSIQEKYDILRKCASELEDFTGTYCECEAGNVLTQAQHDKFYLMNNQSFSNVQCVLDDIDTLVGRAHEELDDIIQYNKDWRDDILK